MTIRIPRGKPYSDTLDFIQKRLNSLDQRLSLLETVGVFAYLTEATDTTVTTAGTYYPILGPFSNNPLSGFDAAVTYTPGIRYTGTKTAYFEVDWSASLYAGENGTTAVITTKKNGVACEAGEMHTYLKYAGEKTPSAGTCVYKLEQGDEVQLVVTSDGNGDIITFENFVTTIKPFIL